MNEEPQRCDVVIGPDDRASWTTGRAVLLYLTVLVAAGVPFGLVAGLLFGWLRGLIEGLVFGLLFSAGIGTMALHAQRSSNRRQAPRQSGRLHLLGTVDELRGHALEVLRALPARKVHVDEPNRVTGRTGTTWRSWGELLSIELEPAAAGTSVVVRSRPRVRTTLVDYGKGRRNVEALTTHLQTLTQPPRDQPGGPTCALSAQENSGARRPVNAVPGAHRRARNRRAALSSPWVPRLGQKGFYGLSA